MTQYVLHHGNDQSVVLSDTALGSFKQNAATAAGFGTDDRPFASVADINGKRREILIAGGGQSWIEEAELQQSVLERFPGETS